MFPHVQISRIRRNNADSTTLCLYGGQDRPECQSAACAGPQHEAFSAGVVCDEPAESRKRLAPRPKLFWSATSGSRPTSPARPSTPGRKSGTRQYSPSGCITNTYSTCLPSHSQVSSCRRFSARPLAHNLFIAVVRSFGPGVAGIAPGGPHSLGEVQWQLKRDFAASFLTKSRASRIRQVVRTRPNGKSGATQAAASTQRRVRTTLAPCSMTARNIACFPSSIFCDSYMPEPRALGLRDVGRGSRGSALAAPTVLTSE